ncbi:MAG TPA: hypothetical protein VJN18_15035 [Polyangiaceae bacterium]|nr:hypothetical protein [Polyangiaceae bacterium]
MKKLVRNAGLMALLSLALTSETAFANTNTQGSAFVARGGADQVHADYVDTGVRNIGPSSLALKGSVGFKPVTGSISFYIDGKNAANQVTSFLLSAYNYDGVLQSSKSFITFAPINQAATYDASQTLDNLSVYSYINLFVSLPWGNTQDTVFYGITANQP